MTSNDKFDVTGESPGLPFVPNQSERLERKERRRPRTLKTVCLIGLPLQCYIKVIIPALSGKEWEWLQKVVVVVGALFGSMENNFCIFLC